MRFSTFTLLAVLLLAGCSPKDYLVTFHTRYGSMKAVLYDATPRHKENFLKLAQEGAYDSTTFHRVIEDFMIQGGDINAKTGEQIIDYTVTAELSDTLLHQKGAIAAARQGDDVNPTKASSGSQFYIVDGKTFTSDELDAQMENRRLTYQQMMFRRLLEKPYRADLRQQVISLQQQGNFAAIQELMENSAPLIEKEFGPQPSFTLSPQQRQAYTTGYGVPHLDRDYTVFGQVVEGLSVIDSIAQVPTGPMDRPTDPVYMRVEVEEVSTKELSKRYGLYYPKEKK